ncbi:hypothetical protein [Acidovorax sp. FG27]|uniref:hypothetical protein n=1 Tax=Acidovorax sp. FG27 TaxID=3133652 RepID=UPI0030E8A618
MLIAHTLLRRCMCLMAQHVQAEPALTSFHTARQAIVGMLRGVYLARASTMAQHMQWLLEFDPLPVNQWDKPLSGGSIAYPLATVADPELPRPNEPLRQAPGHNGRECHAVPLRVICCFLVEILLGLDANLAAL